MSTERRILGNSALLGLLDGAGQAVNLLLVVLLARAYGLEALGGYSFAMALGMLLGTIAGLGATSYATRELARDPARSGELLALLGPPQRAVVLVAVAALVVAALLWPRAGDPGTAVAAVATSQLLSRLTNFQLAPWMARERFRFVAWLGIAERLLALASFAALVALDASFAVASLALPAAAAAALVTATLVARRDAHPPPTRPTLDARLAAIRAALPFMWTVIVATFYQRGGLLVLVAVGGAGAAGTFAAGERLLVPAALLYGTLAAAALPAFARLAAERTRLQELAARCQRISLLATLSLGTLIAMLAPQIVALVWGSPVPGAVPVLRVLVAGAALRSISTLQSTQCQALGAESAVTQVRVVVLLAFALLAPSATLLAGALGLAIATTLTDLLLVLGLARILRRQQCRALEAGAALRAFAAAALAAGVLALLPPMGLPSQALLAATLLAAAMWLTGGVRAHDFRFLRALLRDRSRA